MDQAAPFDAMRLWREQLDALARAGEALRAPSGSADMPAPVQRQLELLHEVMDRQARVQGEWLRRALEPLQAQAAFLRELAEPMRQQAELFRRAADLLDRQAGLLEKAAQPVEQQAEFLQRLTGEAPSQG